MAGGCSEGPADVAFLRGLNMASESISLKAYAKVNLTLEALGRRDDGYHEVATIMQTVDLADRVEVSHGEGLTVECDYPELSGESNLAWKAAVALARRVGIQPRASVRICKRIPVAAGLGGGSADAAATLTGLNELWGMRLAVSELSEVAAELGSDVPFLLTGGTSLGTGRGDELDALPKLPTTDVLLVVPADSIEGKTPTMYRALRPEDFSDGSKTRRIAGSLDMGTLTSTDCCNVFERAAREIFPGLQDVWDRVAEVTQHPPRLSGAGPTIYCMPSTESERIGVAERLQGTGATAYLVRTISPTGEMGT